MAGLIIAVAAGAIINDALSDPTPPPKIVTAFLDLPEKIRALFKTKDPRQATPSQLKAIAQHREDIRAKYHLPSKDQTFHVETRRRSQSF